MALDEETIDMETGEVLGGEPIDASALTLITRADIDMQIATAKRYPRAGKNGDLGAVKKRMWNLIGQDAGTAADCIYALPRKQRNKDTGKFETKIITGPTVRFAEAMVSAWGNSRCGARVVNEEAETVTAQGVFHDLESNVVINFEARKRITNSEGKRYSADMITLTANAACSTALRNAILRGIPQQIWKGAFEAAQKVIKGDVKTLADRRTALLDQFKGFAMTPAMVCQVLGVNGQSDISLDHLVVLQGVLTALQDGDLSVESLLAESQDGAVAEKGRVTLEAIKNQYRKPDAPARPEVAASDKARPEVKAAAAQAQARLDTKRQQTKAKEMTPVSEIKPAAAKEEEPF